MRSDAGYSPNPSHRSADAGGTALGTLWYTRAPVPVATGLAYKLGWLAEEFSRDGIRIETLQESASELRRHHYDHRLPTMVREGGSIHALGARAQGEPTKVIGLTWVDESQAILVRPDSGIATAADLKGKRLALPTWTDHPIASHMRASSISRGMSLHGYKGALASAGLVLDDVRLVEVDASRAARSHEAATGSGELAGLWSFQSLMKGDVDGLYVKGAAALDAAAKYGLTVGVDLDHLPERRFRVNNGTPRPITVHQNLIDNHFEILVRLLRQTLRAADWARDNLADVRHIFEKETSGSAAAVGQAYSDEALSTLHPSLAPDRIQLLDQQKTFLWVHGFIDNDFDLADWVDDRPLRAALSEDNL